MFNLLDNMLKAYTMSDDYKSLLQRIEELESKVKYLEEENIENSNLIYELMNTTDAIDRRIDIVAEKWGKDDVSGLI